MACWNWTECKDLKCPYTHSKGELSKVMYRTVWCKNKDNCSYQGCVFAHNEKEKCDQPNWNVLLDRELKDHLCPKIKENGDCTDMNCPCAHHHGGVKPRTSVQKREKIIVDEDGFKTVVTTRVTTTEEKKEEKKTEEKYPQTIPSCSHKPTGVWANPCKKIEETSKKIEENFEQKLMEKFSELINEVSNLTKEVSNLTKEVSDLKKEKKEHPVLSLPIVQEDEDDLTPLEQKNKAIASHFLSPKKKRDAQKKDNQKQKLLQKKEQMVL